MTISPADTTPTPFNPNTDCDFDSLFPGRCTMGGSALCALACMQGSNEGAPTRPAAITSDDVLVLAYQRPYFMNPRGLNG